MIQDQLDKLRRKTDITRERVLEWYAKLAFFDVRKMFRQDGTPVPLHELDDDVAAAVSSFEMVELWAKGEDGGRTVAGFTRKVRLADRRAALDSIARMLGFVGESGAGSNSNPEDRVVLYLPDNGRRKK